MELLYPGLYKMRGNFRIAYNGFSKRKYNNKQCNDNNKINQRKCLNIFNFK